MLRARETHTNFNELSILIAENDLSFSLELDMLLRDLGYDVVGRVNSTIDLLNSVAMNSPDLILMDSDLENQMDFSDYEADFNQLNIPILSIIEDGDESHYYQNRRSNFIGFIIKSINKFALRNDLVSAIYSFR